MNVDLVLVSTILSCSSPSSQKCVSAFLGSFFLRAHLPRGALLVGVAVHHRYFVLHLWSSPFMLWCLISSVLYELGVRRSWNRTMSWGWWIFLSSSEVLRWLWLSVSKGWPLLTLSLHHQFDALLLTQTIAPFLVARLFGLGFKQGCMAPSSSPHFPRGRFRLLLHSY